MRNLFITLFAFLVLGGSWYYYNSQKYQVIEIDIPQAQEYADFEVAQNDQDDKIDENIQDNDQPEEIPPVSEVIREEEVLGEKIEDEDKLLVIENINLDIPFTSQAPTANWDQPFQDACEEASLLMVDYYYQNKDLPEKGELENILVDMVNWQVENWGDHHNMPVQEVADYAQNTLGYQTQVISDLTAEKIRTLLSQGIPVIVPADGHKLANPFFTGDGPDYHMLVIKGYVDDKFISNDPGTRKGADFVYTEDNLMYSIGDWDSQLNSASGPRVGLVLYRKVN